MVGKLYLVLLFSGGEAPGSPLDVNPGLIIWTTVTFICLLLILKKVAWKPILNSLSLRETSIADALAKAELARKETEELIAKNKADMAKYDEEAQKVVAEAREYGENLKAQIEVQSKATAKKMIDDAKSEIERKQQEAFMNLKEQVADIAIKTAEKIIKANLNNEKQTEIVNRYIDELSKN
ncbi:MAG: F0F1 ATP synthase subunit B [bacterium]